MTSAALCWLLLSNALLSTCAVALASWWLHTRASVTRWRSEYLAIRGKLQWLQRRHESASEVMVLVLQDRDELQDRVLSLEARLRSMGIRSFQGDKWGCN